MASVLTLALLAHAKTFHVDVPMRDGVALYTRVSLPRGDGPFPTVFTRVPYPMGVVLNDRCDRLNRHGYACVWQVVRGRGRSDGDWLPFEHEPSDGADALRWLIEQPWVDGNVAMMGESYLGAVQWAVAESLPPEVKTLIPMVIGTELYDAAYQDGLLRHELISAWMALMPGHEFHYASGSRRYHRALERRPRTDMDLAAARRELPWFDAWLLASDRDAPFWQRDIAKLGMRAPERTTVPILTFAGWSDAFLGPQLATWDKLATRDESVLVVGPWDHLGRITADAKARDVRDGNGFGYVRWPLILAWLDQHLRGGPPVDPGVSTWVVNGDWVTRDAWPPPTAPVVLELGPGEDPQRCTGALGPQGGRGEVRWTYDPSNPTPAVGGAGLLAGALPLWRGVKPGFVDQGRLCERRDDLVGFRSEPLTEAWHVAGPLRATVRFETDAPASAINVRFLEELPNGDRVMVRETIAVGTGDVELETWPVEYVFRPGSRVLVQLASASFPKYEAHPNVAGPIALAATTAVAQQRVVLEGSSVTLPAIR